MLPPGKFPVAAFLFSSENMAFFGLHQLFSLPRHY
jgi:hypothetical protein